MDENLEVICTWMDKVFGEEEGRTKRRANELQRAKLNFALLRAVKNNDLEKVNKWLRFGASVDAKWKMSGDTAVHIAASLADDSILRKLLEEGASPTGLNCKGLEPIHVAVWYGNAAAVTTLCKKDPTAVGSVISEKIKNETETEKDKKGNSLLFCCVNRREKGKNKEEIEPFESDDEPEDLVPKELEKGFSPLHIASTRNLLDIVEHLINEGPKEVSSSHLDVVGIHAEDPHNTEETFMRVYSVLDKKVGSQTRETVKKCTTALHTAVKSKYLKAIRYLLNNKACLDVWDEWGETPIHYTVINGELEPLLEILEWAKKSQEQVKVDTRNRFGFTPLQLAAFLGRPDHMYALLEGGADRSLTTKTSIEFHNSRTWKKILELDSNDFLKVLKSPKSSLDIEEGYVEKQQSQVFLTLDALCCAVMGGRLECVRILGGPKDHHLKSLQEMKKFELEIPGVPDKSKRINYWYNIEDLNNRLFFMVPHLTAADEDHSPVLTHLLENGFDLSFKPWIDVEMSDQKGVPTQYPTLIEATETYVNDKVDHLEEILDSHVRRKRKTIELDYQVLAPGGVKNLQMHVLDVVITPDKLEKRLSLLSHPLTETFLHQKWQKMKNYYNLYVLCQLWMTLLISLLGWAKYADLFSMLEEDLVHILINVLRIFLGFATTVMAVLNCKVEGTMFHNIKWLLYFQVVMWWTAVVFSYLMVLVNGGYEWERAVAAVAVLLSWVELLYLVAKYPWMDDFPLGDNFVMFLSVVASFVQVAASFVLLFAAFSLAFMILLSDDEESKQDPNPFKTLDRSVLKTITMLNDFDGTYFFSNSKNIDSIGIVQSSLLRTVFIAFFLIMCIPLVNFITGITIHDVSALKKKGKAFRIFSEAQTLSRFEKILKKFLPASLFKKVQVPSPLVLKGKHVKNNKIPAAMVMTVYERVKIIEEKDSERKKEERKEQYDEMLKKFFEKENEKLDSMNKHLPSRVQQLNSEYDHIDLSP